MDAPAAGGPPDGTRVGRVALDVADLDEVASFYREVIGLLEAERTDDRVVLGAPNADEERNVDDVTPLVVLRDRSDTPARDVRATGLFHLAIRVPTRAALSDALHRLDDQGQLGGASDHLVSEALYCQDPDGNGVEVYRDRPTEEWPIAADGTVEMETLSLDLDDLGLARTTDDDPGETSADTATVPAGTTIGHVHLEVSDLSEATAFYEDGLGLSVRARYGTAATFLAAEDYHHHVGLNTWNGRTDPAAGRGLAWWEWLVADAAALESVEEHLTAGGWSVTRDENGLAATDPDEIRVRIAVRDE